MAPSLLLDEEDEVLSLDLLAVFDLGVPLMQRGCQRMAWAAPPGRRSSTRRSPSPRKPAAELLARPRRRT
eukprot:1286525-Pyramimonas_sp.AAC.1